MTLGTPQRRPADAIQGGDGLWKRSILRYHPDGTTYEKPMLCCESCWEPMPVYVVAPQGFVSPDSNSKLRNTTVEGRAGVEAVPKIVCHLCYKLEFERFYPEGTDYPHIDATLVGT